uniref:Uncharacterized protein n=1 Tax=Leifsonia xyli subsp. xyli TaxID=59736 RepID=Q7X3M8_LEIXY|nr:hypothetical protein [Leifsonia xyli subsp. xyli]
MRNQRTARSIVLLLLVDRRDRDVPTLVVEVVFGGGGSLLGRAFDEGELDHGEGAVDRGEGQKREEDVQAGRAGRDPVRRLHQAEDDPRLPAHLGEDPADDHRQEGERHRPDGDLPLPHMLRRPALPGQPQAGDCDQRMQHPEADHPAERPVGDPDDRGVVARSVELCVLRLKVIDALDRSVQCVRGEERQQVRHADAEQLMHAVRCPERENGERCVRARRGFVQRLRRRHLHGLRLHHSEAQLVAGDHGADARADHQPQTGFERRPHRLEVLVAGEVPGGDRDDQTGGDHERAEDGVREGREGDFVGQHRADVRQLRPATGLVEVVADRILHEGVGRDDEIGGEDGAGGGHPDRGEVQTLRQFVPAEDPEADEGRFEEESEQTLQGERGAEDVADEARVVGPVHPELELLHDAGHHSHREVDEEELPEEVGQLQVVDFARAIPGGLEHGDDRHEADGERHEQEMVDGGETELPPREQERVEPFVHRGFLSDEFYRL